VLGALDVERADLVGHDWGAWIGFLLALDHPDRFSQYVALNMYPPWPDRRPTLRAPLVLARLWYQALLATPGLGRALIRRTDFVARMITTGAVHPDAWAPEDVESFVSVVREPGRTEASVHLYRTFLLRELAPYIAGRYRGRRLTVPTLLMIGTRDLAIDAKALGEWERWADDMSVELRDDSGHFIAEELPDLVADRALRRSQAG
jgi:pimeloyl-ACP methyl ester carboxylesterase